MRISAKLAPIFDYPQLEEFWRAADDLGFERIWWQEGGTVSESFVPAFDATGVEGPELPRA